MSMITATAWVPRGYAAQFPTRHEFNQDEYDRIAKLAKLQLDDAKTDLEDVRKGTSSLAIGSPENGAAVSKTNG